MTNDTAPTGVSEYAMSIEDMGLILKTSSYTTPGHKEMVEGLDLCAKELPMNDTDYARAFVIRNILVEKAPQVEHLIQRKKAKPEEIEVMDAIIAMLHERTARTRIMNPQIATLQMVKGALKSKDRRDWAERR